MPSLRLGLFGGTFDPPHLGHLLAAQDVADQLHLDRLLFVIAGLPPHKVGEVLSPPDTRLEMVRAAVEGNPLLCVSEIELGRSGPTYTVDTLRLIQKEHPDAQLFFLMGADQLAEFHEWQDPEGILDLATLVVINREGVDPEKVPAVEIGPWKRAPFLALAVPRLDVSSTEIRTRIRNGRSVRYLVPSGVGDIIESHRLYRSVK